MRRSQLPALAAVVLTLAAIGVPGAAWWIAGSREAAREASRLQAAAVAAARDEAEQGSSRLGTRLQRLLDAESRRPFHHYTDPAGEASSMLAVPADPLISAYFQVDASLRVTLPGAPASAADGRTAALRERLARAAPRIVASVRPECPEGAQRQLDAICVGPMLWRTLNAGHGDELVALRHVETREGGLTQGFLVDLAEAEALLSPQARLIAGAGSGGETCDVPLMGDAWHVVVDPSARLQAASDAAAAVRSSFLRAFSAGLAVAALAGLGVLILAWQARRLARQREQFAAAAAHELRTPLAALRLHGGLLASGLAEPARIRLHARHVSGEADRLARVVGNLLAFTLRERGDLGLRIVRCDVPAVVSEQVDRQRDALLAAGAGVEVSCDDGVPLAWCDPDAIAQVVQNLLDNAARHAASAADRRILVTVSAASAGGIAVSVDDAGPGVPARERKRIFEPFARGEQGDASSGLGLGLSLSRSIARACGGDLTYETGARGGARFVLTLSAAA